MKEENIVLFQFNCNIPFIYLTLLFVTENIFHQTNNLCLPTANPNYSCCLAFYLCDTIFHISSLRAKIIVIIRSTIRTMLYRTYTLGRIHVSLFRLHRVRGT